MSTRVRPALTPEQWRRRSTGRLSIEIVDDEVHLTIRGRNNEVTSIADADHLCGLMAVANEALPDSDVRKITAEDVAALCRIAASVRKGDPLDATLLGVTAKVGEWLAALLPPR